MSAVVIQSEIISKFLNNRRSRQHKFENINTIFGTYLVTTHAQIMVIRGHQTRNWKLQRFSKSQLPTPFLQTLQGKQNKDYTKVRYKSSQFLTDFDENILVNKKASLIIYVWKRMDRGNSFSLLLGLSQKWWITMNKSWHV